MTKRLIEPFAISSSREHRTITSQPTQEIMSWLFVTTRDGRTHLLPGQDGSSVMQNIRNAGINELLAICAGSCSCATCHVYVDPADAARLPPMGDVESYVLDRVSMRQAGSRLSCQLIFCNQLDGIRVIIAPNDPMFGAFEQ